MNNNNWLAIVIALWTSGILTAVGHAAIKLINANTKNKNVKLFLGWVDQSIHDSEAKEDLKGAEKKQNSMNYVVSELQKNKLIGKFSEEQISAAIEQGVAVLHNWSPEVKKVEDK